MGIMDNFDHLINRRPWVNGVFIGPSIRDLLLAYYITQGESPKRAEEFAEAHISALRKWNAGA